MSEHIYLSTACLHEDEDPDLHERCRLTCKFCQAPCCCPKHGETGLTPSPSHDIISLVSS
jgi:hypothetical protein